LFIVTASVSCGFYRGMLRYLEDSEFATTLVSSPGKMLTETTSSQGAASLAVPMQREISPLQDLVSLWKLYRIIRRVRPDVVDASTPKAGLLGSLAAMLARVPCRVYTMRGLRMETATGLKRLILWTTERVACSCAHRVVPVSESLRLRAIQLRLVPSEKARVAGNSSRGVDTERFTPKLRNTVLVAQLREQLGLGGKETVIGFVGRFVKDKGIHELVEAFKTLSAGRSDLRLLLVGDFENGDPVNPDIRKYIDTTPTIIRAGFVSDTASYYALMDVIALPTYREGFPGVPLEAQSSEVPVVTTNATGAVDSVKHGITGFIVPVKDAGALSEAIESLLRNPTMRSDMARAGRKWMEQAFRPETTWQARADMYRELLDPHQQRNQRPLRLLAKRVFDVVFATLSLVTLLPLLALVSLVVRIFLGSPVLFRQVRPGYKARPFTCLKFRTMTDNRDAAGRLLSDAQRLTALGRFLRSSSLDELPELVNVIRGEMSLVGPRPLLMEYLERYTPQQMQRHDVRPGITGWAQINGRNTASWEQKFKCDLWYVQNRSLWLDLRIIALTLWKTLTREGISQVGHATMPEFLGSHELSVKESD
jgi:lipopolysaccharide/colanic/teichoic acid biosynthesis glycosyltransferase